MNKGARQLKKSKAQGFVPVLLIVVLIIIFVAGKMLYSQIQRNKDNLFATPSLIK